MATDPFAQLKAAQKEMWGSFSPVEVFTTPCAAHLVEYAGVTKGATVLDVACGTGVVAVTAARQGARVKGLDLSPVLVERARWNASLAQVEVDFTEGDAEALPYPDASFDVVLSQFGHMFAPRPQVVLAEMLRVLKPGGRLAFSTWPPELFTGKMFALVARFVPPPQGVPPVVQWGDVNVVRERLGDAVTDLEFDREMMLSSALSPQHFRHLMESSVGPLLKFVQAAKDKPADLAKFRDELDSLVRTFFRGNTVRQQFLMTRARKRG